MNCIICSRILKFKKSNTWVNYDCCNLDYRLYNYNNNISIYLNDHKNNINICYLLYKDFHNSFKRITAYKNENDLQPIINEVIKFENKINIYHNLKQDYNYCLKYIENLVFL